MERSEEELKIRPDETLEEWFKRTLLILELDPEYLLEVVSLELEETIVRFQTVLALIKKREEKQNER